jgi:hypothetical protein
MYIFDDNDLVGLEIVNPATGEKRLTFETKFTKNNKLEKDLLAKDLEEEINVSLRQRVKELISLSIDLLLEIESLKK